MFTIYTEIPNEDGTRLRRYPVGQAVTEGWAAVIARRAAAAIRPEAGADGERVTVFDAAGRPAYPLTPRDAAERDAWIDAARARDPNDMPF